MVRVVNGKGTIWQGVYIVRDEKRLHDKNYMIGRFHYEKTT